MKISSLLAHYLYEHKSLQLPGIGVFAIDQSVVMPDRDDKNFAEYLSYIQFTEAPKTEHDPALIDFIRKHTGKITPLATADLESFLGLGKEMLNISKPFQIEGIGVLIKTKEGKLDFVAGEPAQENLQADKKTEKSIPQDVPEVSYQNDFARSGNGNGAARAVLLGIGILIALAVVIGGGYLLYNSSQPGSTAAGNALSAPTTEMRAGAGFGNGSDSSSSLLTDSSKLIRESTAGNSSAGPGAYKFIFETTHKRRALRRFEQVHELSPRIQMETKDSVDFRIFVILPSNATDTSWKKDSLKAWYWGTRPNQITIEHP